METIIPLPLNVGGGGTQWNAVVSLKGLSTTTRASLPPDLYFESVQV